MKFFAALCFAILAIAANWLSGAWWDRNRSASLSAAMAAVIWGLVALFLVGCNSLPHDEGDGFGRSNYAGTHQCSDPTPTGEKWRFCTAEEAAAQDAARRRQ